MTSDDNSALTDERGNFLKHTICVSWLKYCDWKILNDERRSSIDIHDECRTTSVVVREFFRCLLFSPLNVKILEKQSHLFPLRPVIKYLMCTVATDAKYGVRNTGIKSGSSSKPTCWLNWMICFIMCDSVITPTANWIIWDSCKKH